MACNCEGKKYNIGMGCCTPVLAPIENYYTKWQVDDLIESATTSGCCITPEEVDELIDESVSGKLDTSTFETYSGTVNTQLRGKANTGNVITDSSVSYNEITKTFKYDKTKGSSNYSDDFLVLRNGFSIELGITPDGGVYPILDVQRLSAGTNVTITGNVISATGTTYTAGDGISISNQNVISTTTKFWCGDEAAYNQIAIKDPNTVYMIHS